MSFTDLTRTLKGRNARRTTRTLVTVLILAATGFLAWWGSRAIGSLPLFELTQIRYEGVGRLEVEPVNKLIKTTLSSNVLKLDLDRVRQIVESEQWVESALVRRQLPSVIRIQVRERQPVAVATIDGELRVVDATGMVLDYLDDSYPHLDRPIVKGLINLALENARQENEQRMKLYLRVLGELERDQDYPQAISEIDVSDPERVAVVPVEQGVPVFLGDRDFFQRYRTYTSSLKLVEEVRNRYGGIESIDVTLDRQIIVRTSGEESVLPSSPVKGEEG